MGSEALRDARRELLGEADDSVYQGVAMICKQTLATAAPAFAKGQGFTFGKGTGGGRCIAQSGFAGDAAEATRGNPTMEDDFAQGQNCN